MPLGPAQPFHEALGAMRGKRIMPTALSSAELSAMAAEVRARALFSARTANAEYLQEVKDVLEGILNPHTETRADGSQATVGMDIAEARLRLKDAHDRIQFYQPEEGERGTIKDLRSDARLNLILRTNVDMAYNYGSFMQGMAEGAVDAFPGQELVRWEERQQHRDWADRWRGAGGTVYAGSGLDGRGRLIARKDDPIWTAISAFGLPYPPFDFNSGVGVRDVSYEECIRLGVMEPGERVEPFNPGMGE